MASVSDFIPDEGDLQAQKTGGEKLSETAFSQNNKPAPKVTGGATAGVSEFTPSAEDLKYQNYDTVGAKGESSLKALSAAEKNIANPPKPPISGAGLTPGVQPKSPLSMAPAPTAPLEMPAVDYTAPSKVSSFTPTAEQASYQRYGTVGAKGERPLKNLASKESGIFAGKGRFDSVSPGVKAATPTLEGIGGRTLSAAKGVVGKMAGPALAIVPEAIGTYKDVTTEGMTPQDKALRITEGATRVGSALAGGEAGATVGAIGGPIGSAAGGILGGAAGYFAPELINRVSKNISGKNAIDLPSEKAAALRAEREPLPVGAPLKNGATVGGEEPKIEFTKPETPKPAVGEKPIEFSQSAWAGQREKDAGSATSKGKGGDFKYVLNEAGKPVKINNATGELVPLTGGITRNLNGDNPLAREAAARANQPQPQQQGYQYEEPDDSGRNELEAIAMSGPNSGMTPGQFAAAKHRQSAALNALSAYDQNIANVRGARAKALDAQMASDQFGAKLAEERASRAENVGLKNRELSAAERHTKAQEDANLLNRQQEAEYKQARLAQGNRALELQEENAKNKPRTVIYQGKKIQGSPDDIAAEKENIDKQMAVNAAAYDAKNPVPTPGAFTRDSSIQEHFAKRAKALGSDTVPSVEQAKATAKFLKDAEATNKFPPEQLKAYADKYQAQYGASYNDFAD